MTPRQIGETYEETVRWLDIHQVCWQFDTMAIKASAICERIDMKTGVSLDKPRFKVRLEFARRASRALLASCELADKTFKTMVIPFDSFETGKVFVENPEMIESLIMEEML